MRETGSVDAYPLNLRTRDGMIRNVTTSSHFYRDARGNMLGVEGVIHDMTEQRKAEDALRRPTRSSTFSPASHGTTSATSSLR